MPWVRVVFHCCFNGRGNDFDGNTNRGFHTDTLFSGEGETIGHRRAVIAGDSRFGIVQRRNDFKVRAVEDDRQHFVSRTLGRNTCVEGGFVWHRHDVKDFQFMCGRRSEWHVKSPKRMGEYKFERLR